MTSYPNTRAEIDALPYRPYWGHWSLQAWTLDMSTMLAEVQWPVVNGCGPWTPHDVKCRGFAELDAAARATLRHQ